MATEEQLNALWDRIHRSRESSREVTVDKAALVALLHEYADIHRDIDELTTILHSGQTIRESRKEASEKGLI